MIGRRRSGEARGAGPPLEPRNEHTPRFERFVRRHAGHPELALFTRHAPNGEVRHFVQVPADARAAFQRSFGARQKVVGLFAVRHRVTDHVYLRLGSLVYDLVLEIGSDGDRAWTMNGGSRRRRFRESSSLLTERLLQLTAAEHARLERHVQRLRRLMRAGGGYLPPSVGDCISAWTLAPVGNRRRTLAALMGIEVVDYVPAVLDALLEEGNSRVLGAVVYPPRGREFRRFPSIRERFLPAGVSPAAASAEHEHAWRAPGHGVTGG